MQIGGGVNDPELWRQAVESRPWDPDMRLGLAKALVSHSIKVSCSGKDGSPFLAECAFTLCAVGDLDLLSSGQVMLFAGTAAGCASGLVTAGRPRLALGMLAAARYLLDSRSDLAGTSAPQAKPLLPGSEEEAEAGSRAKSQALAASARRSGVARSAAAHKPCSPEDDAPGAVFPTPWPLPVMSWHYLRASVALAEGCARAAVGEIDQAKADLSEALLVAFAGAPYDYARTVSLSSTIGRRLEQLFQGSEPQGRTTAP
ncbi:hypothetical protein RN607_09255 [Demequina capsici]|uniref:Uncharacterized protein n=1 Tax=Demequina capsici TaxID=3075620 RepID=A0AA96F3V3_9MICO|nr:MULTISPECIES: hypothetical protein [unclassified Demequina]WNM23511.1 hypothetical protein RN606_09030 [Demequina sp. OYTSA14]WNM26388.1 hypothetical protein RN607_09255 [Demequina sp. PMTSA13]